MNLCEVGWAVFVFVGSVVLIAPVVLFMFFVHAHARAEEEIYW